MATKTISLELDAYEKLKNSRLHPKESFSSVVRRAEWENRLYTGRDVLELMKQRSEEGDFLSEEILNRLEAAQKHPRRSPSRWEKH